MRVTNVGLYSNNVEAMNVSLIKADPTAQYIVKNITGLDAEELIPKFYGFGANVQTKFYDFSMKPRDIVMSIILNPRFRFDEAYSDVRDELYRAISSARTGLITLYFNASGTTVAKISGFFTKFEVSHFTALPEVKFTILCNDPMFRAINPVIFDPLELKTTNPIIVGDTLSTAPHGFSMCVTFKNASANFTVQDAATPEWIFKVIPDGGFLAGDVLHFSSDTGNKYLYMIRSSVITHLMDRIQPGSIWPVIFPGANSFHFVEIANFDWEFLEYYAAYWGV